MSLTLYLTVSPPPFISRHPRPDSIRAVPRVRLNAGYHISCMAATNDQVVYVLSFFKDPVRRPRYAMNITGAQLDAGPHGLAAPMPSPYQPGQPMSVQEGFEHMWSSGDQVATFCLGRIV
jgi:hypothetical protein